MHNWINQFCVLKGNKNKKIKKIKKLYNKKTKILALWLSTLRCFYHCVLAFLFFIAFYHFFFPSFIPQFIKVNKKLQISCTENENEDKKLQFIIQFFYTLSLWNHLLSSVNICQTFLEFFTWILIRRNII